LTVPLFTLVVVLRVVVLLETEDSLPLFVPGLVLLTWLLPDAFTGDLLLCEEYVLLYAASPSLL